MSKSAKTVLYFGMYVIVLGTVIVLAPNFILRVLNQPETKEIWFRVAGMLLLLLGVYYVEAARAELTRFFQLTVYGRVAVMLFFIAFVVFCSATPLLIAFAAVDLCAAGWTQWALNREKSAGNNLK